jgi:autotransporter-associated beta strand protein
MQFFRATTLTLCLILPAGQAWAALCNGGANVTGALTISANCDGASSKPLTLDTGANVTINPGVTVSNDAGSGRNGDPISILASATSSAITNKGTIYTGSQWDITNSGTLTSLTNFGSISSGVRRGIVNNNTIGTITNVGTIDGPFADITNSGTLTTLNNLQGAGNSSGALTNAVNLPANYNIIINDTSHYGQLSAASGFMNFNIYGNTGTALVSGVAASTVAAGTYANVLQGFSSLTGITGTTGTYSGLNYSLVAHGGISGNWDLVFTVPATNITSGLTGSTSDLGTTLNPTLDGGILQVASAGTIATPLTITTNNGTIDQNGLSSTFSGIISDDTPGQASKLTIINSGSGGAVTLSGVNSYSGGTEVNTGATLQIAAANALGSGPLALIGNSTVPATLSITGTTTITNAISVAGDPVFNVAPGTTTTIAAPITDGGIPGDVVVQGGGTLELTAANSYTGLTNIVSGSTLALSGSGSISTSSPVTNSGTFNIASAISPITLSGAYTQASSGNLVMNAAPGSFQKLEIAGLATIGGGLTLNASPGTYAAGKYSLLSAGGGVAGAFSLSSNLGSFTTLGYGLAYDANNVYLLLTPNPADTQTALESTASTLQGVFTLQNTALANGMNYDCPVFSENGACVSINGGGTLASGKGTNSANAILIAGFRLSDHFRIGGYLDQNLATGSPSGITIQSKPTPGVGIFGAWSQSPAGTGAEVKISAGYGKQDITITRLAINTSEAGSGSSTITSKGAQLVGKYGFAIADNTIAAPYVGIRYTTNNSDSYTEQNNVASPLSYSAINTSATTAIAGIGLKFKPEKLVTLLASAGMEKDLQTNNGTYEASGLSGLAPINFNPNPVTLRPTASLGAYYEIEKNQRLGITAIYRQEPFRPVSTEAAMASYTVGF